MSPGRAIDRGISLPEGLLGYAAGVTMKLTCGVVDTSQTFRTFKVSVYYQGEHYTVSHRVALKQALSHVIFHESR